jgi:hypothetical protein
MNDRGTYGRAIVGADLAPRRPSHGTGLVGALVVVGAVLWARHQSRQIERLYAAAGLPHQSFAAGLRERTRELSHGLTRRLSTRKET